MDCDASVENIARPLSSEENKDVHRTLLSLIEERPIIWKIQDDTKPYRELRREAYAEVARELNAQFDLSYDVDIVKDKFKKMKYSLKRHNTLKGKAVASGNIDKRLRTPYRYAAEMEFLENSGETTNGTLMDLFNEEAMLDFAEDSKPIPSTTSGSPQVEDDFDEPRAKRRRQQHEASNDLNAAAERRSFDEGRMGSIAQLDRNETRCFADYISSCVESVQARDPLLAIQMKHDLIDMCLNFQRRSLS
ncbi:hypothetical protein QR680_004109 [Steinernema hermaphroditum]|uniref:MADF domain-containing protein n=1 Tax=Steinernema hermaphroditum TaxID=289476 RepID=A0AA39HP37_9BILA|nr:hypothetical protein QR680_004109 [Steinernema hermaphroditum]